MKVILEGKVIKGVYKKDSRLWYANKLGDYIADGSKTLMRKESVLDEVFR